MTVDRGVIEQQLKALGEGARWWEHRELRDLPSVLHPEERILAISRGGLGGLRPLRRSWLIVVTDQRLLCLRSAGGSGWRQLEMSAGQIERTTLRVGPFRMKVVITGGGEKIRVFLPRDEAYKLSRALSNIATPAREAPRGFGPARMFRRVLDHMLDLPAVAFDPHAVPGSALMSPRVSPVPDADERAHLLEREVEELREQVRFLEQLVEEKQERQGTGAYLTR
jgi:hypothetical protein